MVLTSSVSSNLVKWLLATVSARKAMLWCLVKNKFWLGLRSIRFRSAPHFRFTFLAQVSIDKFGVKKCKQAAQTKGNLSDKGLRHPNVRNGIIFPLRCSDVLHGVQFYLCSSPLCCVSISSRCNHLTMDVLVSIRSHFTTQRHPVTPCDTPWHPVTPFTFINCSQMWYHPGTMCPSEPPQSQLKFHLQHWLTTGSNPINLARWSEQSEQHPQYKQGRINHNRHKTETAPYFSVGAGPRFSESTSA